ncbi:hypothetical protein KEJ15_04515 [Candidatus Bathyarchaeota archaeon]|nr:hypothetical protein [Candidatus Bathyarchaeota archaeon]
MFIFENSKGRNRIFLVLYLLGTLLFVAFRTDIVAAIAPEVLAIEYQQLGENTVLYIYCRHTISSTDHYVNAVQLNISGTIETIKMVETRYTFIVEYDMGEVSGMPEVWARANCTVSGWGEWCGPVVVPEFPVNLFAMLLTLVAVTTLPIVTSSYLRNKKQRRTS